LDKPGNEDLKKALAERKPRLSAVKKIVGKQKQLVRKRNKARKDLFKNMKLWKPDQMDRLHKERVKQKAATTKRPPGCDYF